MVSYGTSPRISPKRSSTNYAKCCLLMSRLRWAAKCPSGPAQIDGVRAKLGEWIILIFHLRIMLFRLPARICEALYQNGNTGTQKAPPHKTAISLEFDEILAAPDWAATNHLQMVQRPNLEGGQISTKG